jgi:hypothetical protein
MKHSPFGAINYLLNRAAAIEFAGESYQVALRVAPSGVPQRDQRNMEIFSIFLSDGRNDNQGLPAVPNVAARRRSLLNSRDEGL